MKRTFTSLAKSYPPDVGRLAVAAKKYLLSLMPGLHEELDPSAPYVFYSYGPGYKGMVYTLFLSKSAVKIGLVYGSDLPDPYKLLAGKGKVHKHVELKSPADLEMPGLKQLIKDCDANWRKRQSAQPVRKSKAKP